jgi:Ion channel
MILISFISVLLAVMTSGLHFEIMTRVAALRDRLAIPRRLEVLILLIAAFAAHVAGVLIYAVAYAWLHYHPDFGTLAGKFSGSVVDYVYFSLTCYTTLGFGDVYATGDMRLVSGIEGLNGLVLIAWSASFTFLSVQRGWQN